MTREQLFRWFFFGVFGFLFMELLRLFSPFFPAFLWAATLTVAFYPVHAAVRARVPWKDAAALVSTLAVLLLGILPLTLLAWMLVRESVHLYPAAKAWLDELRGGGMMPRLPPALQGLWLALDDLLEPAGLTLESLTLSNLDALAAGIANGAAGATKELFFGLVNFVLMAITLFFSFRHSDDLLAWSLDLLPMQPVHKRALVGITAATFASVVRGILAFAVIEGILAGLGFALAGTRLPLFFGVACALTSLVPYVGAALVWAPAGLVLLAWGRLSGLFLLVWGAVVIAGLGTFLRSTLAPPLKRTPVLLLLFSILGGVRVYGFNGLLLGPLVAACLMAFVKIYREEYQPPLAR